MDRRLYIISNGLKDLRGHYFETSASIAEASRGLGLRPVLAAHVHCPREIIPGGVEFHPVFTTDHWMTSPPPPQPDHSDLCVGVGPSDVAGSFSKPKTLTRPPGTLSRGERGSWLPPLPPGEGWGEGRFGERDVPGPWVVADSTQAPRDGTIGVDRHPGAQSADEKDPAREAVPLGQRVQVGRLIRAVLPPAVRRLILPSKELLRRVLPPSVWNLLRGILRSKAFFPPPAESPPLDAQLGIMASSHELEYSLRFGQDLERLLCLTGCSPDDHVYLPTAHGRELCAILHLLANLPVESRPTFHLEFRHELGMSEVYHSAHRVFFEIARMYPASESVRLYTDTEELAEEYGRFSGLEFGVLPIPFRSRLIGSRPRAVESLCIAFFGDAREEKGFHWLPDLVDELMDDYVRPGRVRFLIQASVREPEEERRCTAAVQRLRTYSEDHVRLVGLEEALAPENYYQLFSSADLLLCPYHPEAYRNRSSGILTEAIAAGIPTVVPLGSWLSRQQPPGGGETFVDRRSFNEAVRKVCDHYASYHSRARAGRESWLVRHSPERLVRSLLCTSDEREPRTGKVA